VAVAYGTNYAANFLQVTSGIRAYTASEYSAQAYSVFVTLFQPIMIAGYSVPFLMPIISVFAVGYFLAKKS
jgi:hypothetical protein